MKGAETSNNSHSRYYLSLKWKALLLLGLLLLLINSGMGLLGEQALEERFQQQLDDRYRNHRLYLDGQLRQSFAQLQRLGALISQEGGDKDSDGFAEEIGQHWPVITLEWNIVAAALLDADGRRRQAWGENAALSFPPPWRQRVMAGKRPLSGMHCGHECRLFVLLPILKQGRPGRVLVLVASLPDLIMAYHQVTGTNLAILEHGDGGSFGNWPVSLKTLTSRPTMQAVLERAARRFPLQALDRGLRLRIDEREYELRHFDLPRLPGNEHTGAIIIDDITEDIAHIRGIVHRLFLASSIGILLTALLLLLLLWQPMQRVMHLTATLPRLARHEFGSVAATLRAHDRSEFISDEIDILHDTAQELTRQLDNYARKTDEHAREVETQRRVIEHDRDFVTGLLNTAPVMILTQDAQGRLTMANRHAERIVGYAEGDMIGRNFTDLIYSPERQDSLERSLGALLAGEHVRLEHESGLLDRDGNFHTISWLHSRLGRSHGDGSVVISVGMDISDRIEAEKRLSWLADHDALTSLYNRRRFQQDFQEVLAIAARYQRSGALLYLDLDEFKFVNDTSGHQAGDALLQIVATKLRNIIRGSDLVCRLGGDEFAVVMRETDVPGATGVAKKIIRELARTEIPVADAHLTVACSIGIVMFPEHGQDVHELLANADLAMYQAKSMGKGGWHLFTRGEGMRERMQDQMHWRNAIEEALRNDRFQLQYQPILDLGSNTVSHYEVLVRMRGEDGQLIPPGMFIPVAEHTGLIHAIDHWVLQHALMAQSAFREQNRDISLSINLSGRDIDDPELLSLLKHTLDDATVNPAHVVFELTETAAVADISAAIELMHEIRGLGCRFALDDFGVGFSSFAYLKQLPVDFVKIDGSFIRHLSANRDDQVFVKALTEVARGLGKKTIAEFVEDEQTLELLRAYGVDYAQGYHIGAPGDELPPG